MPEHVRFPCPCCGFQVFESPPGSFDICIICGWEDDAVQLANPCTGEGANTASLAEAQENFQSTPDADLAEYREQAYVRDPKWRRLNMNEKEIFRNESEGGTRWINPAVTDERGYYWQRNTVQEKT